MRRVPWDEETDAGRVVTHFLGGIVRRVDPGGGSVQLHDLDVLLPDGVTIAIEVTRHNSPQALAVLGAIDKRRWKSPELSNVWVVDTTPTVSVAALHRDIARLLQRLEAAGIDTLLVRRESFDATMRDEELDDEEREERDVLERTGTQEVAEELSGLGVRLAYSLLPAPTGGEVIVGEASQAGSTAAAVVAEAVEYHASRSDNIAKLKAASDRAERHLFVWIESSQHAAVAAFGIPRATDGEVTAPAPKIPECVDTAWAVTAFEIAHVWRYHRVTGWRDLGSVTLSGRQSS